MHRSLALALHLIEMVGDTINFDRRLLDCLGRAIGGLRRFVCSGLRLCRRLFGLLGSFLSLGGCGFGLPGLLLVVRRTSCDRNRENQKRQHGKKSAHQL